MAQKFKAVVRYDGTDFVGWQVQPEKRTVQGCIEQALGKIAQATVKVDGAGRTDSGVHALGQVCSFSMPDNVTPDRLRRSLSQMLSPSVRVLTIEPVAPDFHARYSATGKRYAYAFSMLSEPDPFSARYAWRLPSVVDTDRLQTLSQRLVGEHDFAGFRCSSATETQSTVRTIHSITLRKGGVVAPVDAEGLWCLEFDGTGFLYKMIRNTVGTLVDIARGAIPPERLDELLVSPGPYRGFTAPAHGLALVEVRY